MAEGLELETSRRGSADCYFTSLALELLPKRDQLARVLESLGMHPVIPEGGYFMLADISQMSELFCVTHNLCVCVCVCVCLEVCVGLCVWVGCVCVCVWGGEYTPDD